MGSGGGSGAYRCVVGSVREECGVHIGVVWVAIEGHVGVVWGLGGVRGGLGGAGVLSAQPQAGAPAGSSAP